MADDANFVGHPILDPINPAGHLLSQSSYLIHVKPFHVLMKDSVEKPLPNDVNLPLTETVKAHHL